MKFSANLGLLWKELSLPDAILAAADNGFSAVECHWPYETDSAHVLTALRQSGLRMLCLNTSYGDLSKGEFGLCALPDREHQARADINQVIAYAKAVEASNIHVMAGNTQGINARATFIRNLESTLDELENSNVGLLIEPLNMKDRPNYFLNDLDFACEIISHINDHRLKLMFDCYHIHLLGYDVVKEFEKRLPYIGHIQIASVPGRLEPNQGVLDFKLVLQELTRLKYDGFIGAEYHPETSTENSLNWLNELS